MARAYESSLVGHGAPWATLAAVATTLALAAFPGAAAALEYDAARMALEPWRLVTSQLVHWSGPMLTADVLLLGVVGALVERRSRPLAWLALLLGGAATAVAVPLLTDLVRFRGSSGLGTALLAAGAVDLAARPADRRARLVALLALAILVVKILLETTDGAGGGVSSLPAGVAPVPAVHLAGAAAGALAGGLWTARTVRARAA